MPQGTLYFFSIFTMTDSTTTTPQEGTGEQPQEIIVDGVKYTADDIKKGMLRQDDYTKKTQQLAEDRKKLEEEKKKLNIQDETPITAEAARKIAQEAAETTRKQIESERATDEFFNLNPHLALQRTAIEAVARANGIAVEDAAEKFKFAEPSKLNRRTSLGESPNPIQKAKSVEEMSIEEYEAHKKEQGIGRRSSLTRSSQ